MDIEDLDLSWINEFEKIDNEYNIYYTEEQSKVYLFSPKKIADNVFF